MSTQQFDNLDAQLGDVDRYPIDMVIEVDDGEGKMYRIGVNQSLVCAELTVLGEAMDSDMKEGTEEVVKIGADFATKENVRQLLDCVYDDDWKREFDANALDIYRLAHMYGGFCAPFQLAAVAVERSLTTTNFWAVLQTATQFRDRRLPVKCESFALQPQNYKKIMADESWTMMVTASKNEPIVRMLASITKYAALIVTATSKIDRFWRAVQEYNSDNMDNFQTCNYYDNYGQAFPPEFKSLLDDALDYAKTVDLASGVVYNAAVRAPTESFARMQTALVSELCKIARDAKK